MAEAAARSAALGEALQPEQAPPPLADLLTHLAHPDPLP